MPSRRFKVPILMYHRIAEKPAGTTVPGHYCAPGVFESHVRGLRRLGFRSISVQELSAAIAAGQKIPGKRVAFTFDDGYRNFMTNALPIMARHDVTGTVFLVTDLLGRTNEWDERNGDVTEPLMSLDEVIEAKARGTELGTHTRTHADLVQSDPEAAFEEIEGSKRRLEDQLKAPVKVFCYPYGYYNRDVRLMVERAGYSGACSTRKGVVTPQTDPYLLNRINVRSDTTLPLLIYKLVRGLAFGR